MNTRLVFVIGSCLFFHIITAMDRQEAFAQETVQKKSRVDDGTGDFEQFEDLMGSSNPVSEPVLQGRDTRSSHQNLLLHDAAEKGDLKTLEESFGQGVDIESPDRFKYARLHRACAALRVDCVKELLRMRSSGMHGETPLHAAASNPDDAAVELFLRIFDARWSYEERMQRFFSAADQGDIKELKWFLKFYPDLVHQVFGIGGKRALHAAAESGHDTCVQALLEAGALVNATDKDGKTALQYAAKACHVGCLKLLLDKGASVEVKDNNHIARWSYEERMLRFFLAAYQGDIDELKRLLKFYPDLVHQVFGIGGKRALHTAAESGHDTCVQALLEAGALLNATDQDGKTALHYAAKACHVGCLKLLLDKGASVEVKDNNHMTVLHHCVAGRQAERLDMLRLVLEKGPSVTAVDKRGLQALALAALNGFYDAVQLLSEHYTDLRSDAGCTLFMVVAYLSKVPLAMRPMVLGCIALMIAKKLSPEGKDENGFTALHHALCLGDIRLLQLLIDAGVDGDAVARYHGTPLDLAVEKFGSSSLHADLLREYAKKQLSGKDLSEHCRLIYLKIHVEGQEVTLAPRQIALSKTLTDLLSDLKDMNAAIPVLSITLETWNRIFGLTQSQGDYTPLELLHRANSKGVLKNDLEKQIVEALGRYTRDELKQIIHGVNYLDIASLLPLAMRAYVQKLCKKGESGTYCLKQLLAPNHSKQ